MGTKPIIQKETSEKVVFDYHPKEFPIVVTETADDFIQKQPETSTDFVISPLVAEQAGIAERNRKKVEARVEEQALEKLKEVEEKAYEEAYKLGLDEGRERSFEKFNDELTEKLSKVDELLLAFENIKDELLEQNESHIIRLTYLLASRIAMKEIKEDKATIFSVITEVVKEAQTDENIQVLVSKDDFEFIEELRKRKDMRVDQFNHIKFSSSERISTGGCILESNYGSIDASIEQRVNRAWAALEARLPRLKGNQSSDSNSDDET